MIRAAVILAFSLITQVWPIYCADSSGQPVTLTLVQSAPPTLPQSVMLCLENGLTQDWAPRYRYDFYCQNARGKKQQVILFSVVPLAWPQDQCYTRGLMPVKTPRHR